MSDEAPDTVLEGLANENHLLKNWVLGILDGCEDCTEQATKWMEAMRDTIMHEGQG